MRKKPDLAKIQIERIIVHDIPKHKINDLSAQPRYSERESSLTGGLRLFFKDKTTSALTSNKHFVIKFNEGSDSPLPNLVNTLLSEASSDFVEISKKCAERLFSIQSGQNAGGILVIMLGTIDDHKICIFLKLEKDMGAQLELNSETQSFDIVEVQNLMLTNKTKIYKVAIFFRKEDFSIPFDGIVMDYQIDVKLKKEAITFFVDKFLGCTAFEEPKIVTQRFYNVTRDFIYTVSDTTLIAKYIQDLNSYLQKNTNYVSPKEFAEDYFDNIEHIESYRQSVSRRRMSFDEQYPKSNELVDNRIKRITIEFENNILLVGKKGVLKEGVHLSKLQDGRDKAEIISKIKKIA